MKECTRLTCTRWNLDFSYVENHLYLERLVHIADIGERRKSSREICGAQ